MQRKSLFTVKCTLNSHPTFLVVAKDFPAAARKAEKLVREHNPEAEILEITAERRVLLEDLPEDSTTKDE